MKRLLFLTLFALAYLLSTVQAQDIIFITDDVRDSVQIQFLEDAGYNVTTYYPEGGLSVQSTATINWLNSADLIIIGRSPSSGDFDAPDKPFWNSLKAPLILNTQWAARSSRLNWFPSNSASHANDEPDTAYANILIPGDGIFSGVTLVGDSLDWMTAPHDYLVLNDTVATNAEVLVRWEAVEGILVARFDPYIEFYPGAGDFATGYRTYFGFGNDDLWKPDYDTIHYFPLTEAAQTVYLAEIDRLISLSEPAAHIIFMSDDERDSVQIQFLKDNGYAVTQMYPGNGLSNVTYDTLQMLDNTDLVIIGRSPNSGDFDGNDKPYWNGIKAPVILNTQWAARSSRLNWFPSNSASHANDGPDTAYANILIPGDGIFSGVTLVGDSLDWMTAPHDYLVLNDTVATNAEVLVRWEVVEGILVARFDPYIEFYPGAGDLAAGYRTYFGFGNDDPWSPDYDTIHYFPLTEAAQTVYLAEIERLLSMPEPTGANIIFMTDDERDSVQIKFLEDNGYIVTQMYPGSGLSNVTGDTLSRLNAADLVIIGRSPNSGDFDGNDKPYWNSIKAPVILNTQWAARSSRLNWFPSNSASHANDGPDTAYANILIPEDDIFSGITLVGDSIDWMTAPHDYLVLNDTVATNAEVLVRWEAVEGLLVARFNPFDEFYPKAVDYAAGYRTYFGFGNDDPWSPDYDTIHYFPLTEAAQTVYLAEIDRLLNGAVPVTGTDANLAILSVSEGELSPDFNPDTIAYSVVVADSIENIVITAIAQNTNATVDGAGEVGVPSVTTITVTPESGDPVVYTVTIIAVSDDATLSDLTVDGTTVDGFNSDSTTYNVVLPAGTTLVPTVGATATDAAADVQITQASDVNGSATVVVTATNGETSLTYTVNFSVGTGLNPLSIDKLNFYPNPATSTIAITNIENVNYVDIFNLAGEKVLTKTVTNNNGEYLIDITELSSGMYLIRAYGESNLIGIGKFSKQ